MKFSMKLSMKISKHVLNTNLNGHLNGNLDGHLNGNLNIKNYITSDADPGFPCPQLRTRPFHVLSSCLSTS